MTITHIRRVQFKRPDNSAYKPVYETNELELLSELVSIRRFAERAGIRNAATMLKNDGMPLDNAMQVLLAPQQHALFALFHYQNRMNEHFADMFERFKRG